MEERRGLDLLAADAGGDERAEQPRRVHGVEHVGGNDAVPIDPVGGPRDQGNKAARLLDQLGAALRLVGGA